MNRCLEKVAAHVSEAKRNWDWSVTYRGQKFFGFNKPKIAPAGDSHKRVVLAKKGEEVKVVRYGAEAGKSYLASSGGIKGKDDKFSANHWARKDLWGKNSTVKKSG